MARRKGPAQDEDSGSTEALRLEELQRFIDQYERAFARLREQPEHLPNDHGVDELWNLVRFVEARFLRILDPERRRTMPPESSPADYLPGPLLSTISTEVDRADYLACFDAIATAIDTLKASLLQLAVSPPAPLFSFTPESMQARGEAAHALIAAFFALLELFRAIRDRLAVGSRRRTEPSSAKRKPGRPSDPEQDQRILDTWNSGRFATDEQLGEHFGKSADAVRKAKKRAQKRNQRKE